MLCLGNITISRKKNNGSFILPQWKKQNIFHSISQVIIAAKNLPGTLLLLNIFCREIKLEFLLQHCFNHDLPIHYYNIILIYIRRKGPGACSLQEILISQKGIREALFQNNGIIRIFFCEGFFRLQFCSLTRTFCTL